MNSLHLVNNPRSGASVAIEKVVGRMTFNDMLLLTGVICLVAGIASLFTLYLGRKVPQLLVRLDYRKLSMAMMVFMAAMVVTATGILGLAVLAVAASMGILCTKLKVNRSSCMGVLLVPSIIFFLGLNPFVLSLLNI